ncbi:DNA-binding transcriptional LysR family regulator [Paenibacillus forsythiae]|uniref:DNA-binding transcriptional LysR family regulator n=1 Tax=Paenibacillus forsythiae TaxID=365616 RepID=A0ABU3H1R2_9BACL|nr:DNA-binding transcriptional LysR family regulator [Paenibacillus forsythiae]
MSGLGISFLPLVTVLKELADGTMARLNWDDESQRVATQVAYHKKKWKSPALDAFMETVRQKMGKNPAKTGQFLFKPSAIVFDLMQENK